MKYALMQPYFFPYLGYFALIAATDYWIVFDEAQYTRRSWIARNRILSPAGGWQYLTVPVQKNCMTARIRDVEIATDNFWHRKLPSRLQHYRKHAPFYEPVMTMLGECLEDPAGTICELNIRCLETCCAYFGIPFHFERLSALDLNLDHVCKAGDWAWVVGRQIGGTHYLNLPGGRSLYLRDDFENAGIGLEFLSIHPYRYDQGRADFEPDLSIIDVAMFNSPERIRELLREVSRERVV